MSQAVFDEAAKVEPLESRFEPPSTGVDRRSRLELLPRVEQHGQPPHACRIVRVGAGLADRLANHPPWRLRKLLERDFGDGRLRARDGDASGEESGDDDPRNAGPCGDIGRGYRNTAGAYVRLPAATEVAAGSGLAGQAVLPVLRTGTEARSGSGARRCRHPGAGRRR